jgi:hypothetical protein
LLLAGGSGSVELWVTPVSGSEGVAMPVSTTP